MMNELINELFSSGNTLMMDAMTIVNTIQPAGTAFLGFGFSQYCMNSMAPAPAPAPPAG